MIRVNNILPRSTVNGVGLRTVVWTQGCNLRCKGCFNPSLWNFEKGYELDVTQFVASLPSDIEGITISGGEPVLQENLFQWIKDFKTLRPDLSIILFTGFSMEELYFKGIKDFDGIDVLIAGRYVESKKIANNLRGSSNKTYYFFTDRYTLPQLEMPKFEITVTKDEIIFTGMLDSRIIMNDL